VRERDGRVTVLYMGRTYEDKGGPLAADVFAALAELPARLVWVGEAPREADPQLTHVEFHRTRARDRYRALLEDVDIFLSPSEHESYGMGLVEAAAHGAALVTTRGRGMEHVEELFVAGEHALLTDNALPREARLASVLRHVRTLVENPELRHRMQEANRKLVADGALALTRRNRKLSASYARLAEPVEHRGKQTSFSARWSAAAMRLSYRSYSGGVPSRVLVR
jgi:glycosyltransferase involved in cell wall biosynthesis